jgi:hypothetical protein
MPTRPNRVGFVFELLLIRNRKLWGTRPIPVFRDDQFYEESKHEYRDRDSKRNYIPSTSD